VKITTVDTHTEGQPTRIVVSGIDELPGETMEERRRVFRDRYDHLRTGLLGEPRGHQGMFGCVLTEPCDPRADFGVIFIHNSGYVDVSGPGMIGVATALIETGIIEPDGGAASVTLETPSGVVVAHVQMKGSRAASVTFRSVPAWVALLGASLQLPDHGEVIVDVAFAGNLYVWAWAEHLGIELAGGNIDRVIEVALEVREAANEKLVVRDPESGERRKIDVVTILDAPHNDLPALRTVNVFGDGQFARSPGGMGASARLAVMFDRGEILMDEEVVIESAITNGTLRGRVVEEVRAGARNAVITEITGSAHITGIHDFVFDAGDPLSRGFLIGGSGS